MGLRLRGGCLLITEAERQYLLEHPGRVPRWREYIEAGANVYLHDGPVPCNLFILDDTVLIGNSQSDIGEHLVGIGTRNETVRSWAHGMIATYKQDAKRLDAASFTQDSIHATEDTPG